MEIFKKGLFGKHKPVIFNVEPKDIGWNLRALPEGEYFYLDVEGKKVFHESAETTLDKWIE